MQKKFILITCVLFFIGLVSGLTIESVSSEYESIAPGQSSDLVINLKNNAEADVRDVRIALDFTNVPLAPYGSGSETDINEIKEGKTKEVNFRIIALNDARSGIYKIPIKITYFDDDVEKTVNSLISVMVNSEPIVEVDVEDGVLLKDKTNKITLKIINKGLANVKFLEIEAENSGYYSLLSQKRIYVGDVDSDDFQTVDYQVYFKSNSPNQISIPISIKYKDITNKEYKKNFDIQLRVYDQKQAQRLGLIKENNTIYYFVGIVLIVVGFVIYKVFRKRNLETLR